MDLGVTDSFRRIGSEDVFGRSSRQEDDEEALKWAAIERLPTFDRLRKGIVTNLEGGTSEVDIRKLGFRERKNLIDRLVGIADEDNEKFLLMLGNRLERVGIEIPTIEVRFEHLNVETDTYVGSRALPTILNFTINMLEAFFSYLHIFQSRKKHLTILHNARGIVKPGRLTLLLGPPSCGKTTLLLALAGKLDPHLKVSGSVTYNGHNMDEFVPQRTAAYISQYDLHIGEMTVRETLAFAARCQGVGSRYELLEELSRRELAANIKPDPIIDTFMKAAATESHEANVVTDYILKILGLEACADTLVGDAMIRGISGGQRKRVTTGEMLVGPARALFMDEISTGLDSSTTFQIVNSVKQYVHILKATAVISLLQPAPETYDLFDDIILLSEGHTVYQGPRDEVLGFFESMGFICPERKGVADFLQEVMSRKDQGQYWKYKEKPCHIVTPREFSEAFQSFHLGRKLGDELAVPFDRSKSHRASLTTQQYGVRKIELLKACLSKEILLMKRNSFVYTLKLFRLIVMALITMTVFLRTEMHHNSITDGGIYSGALFFEITMIMFNGLSELSMTVAKLPVFYKQRDFLFYPAWAYSIPLWILKIPITILEVVVWVSITYYGIGFDPNIKSFFKQFLLLLLLNQMASALFRFIAALSRNMVVAYTIGCFVILFFYALGGFILSREGIKKWWTWAYWNSPVMYAQNAIVVNEFLGKSWAQKIFPNSEASLGVAVLKSRGFFTHAYWYWVGVGALLGYVLLFNIGFILALSFLDPFGKAQAVITEESENNDDSYGRVGGDKLRRNMTSGTSVSRMETRIRGMILPFEQYSITFQEITYSVDMPQEIKDQGVPDDKFVLLKGISGVFRPGILTALMGMSGAGKTTLMDVLAGRKTGGYIEGNIKIAGYPKKQETFARILGYCEQNNIHSPHVTVYEALLYSAWLRLPCEVDSETRKMFIEEVMELVELKTLRQALVGLPGENGLSIEQRKRLTIAVELVANPSIIFMDEPTSGLDARAAGIIMRTVRNIVDTGRTVVCTIHQPSIDIFEAFDELFLLKPGGQEIYAGPLGRHSFHLIDYFEEIHGVDKIKDGNNPATWMLEVTSPSQELALGVDFSVLYKKSELYRMNMKLIEELGIPALNSKDLHFPTQYSQSLYTQFMACLWKQHWSYWRNPPYSAVRLLFTLATALMFGSMFWDIGSRRKTQEDIFNSMGSMYAATIFVGFQNGISIQPVVSIERTVFYRERAAGMYSALPYALARVMIELPYVFVQAGVYSVIMYSMMGFEWTVPKFMWHFLVMYFTLLYFTFYGMMAVALTPNSHIAVISSSAFFTLWSLFSGFVVPRNRTSIWWRWYFWLCPVAWTLYGLVASQYGDVKEELEIGVTVEEFVRQYFDFRYDFLGPVAAVIVGFAVLFAFIFAISISIFNFQKR